MDEFGLYPVFEWFGEFTPARQKLTAWGYDKQGYISTANLAPVAYTSQPLIQAKLGGLIRLIEAVDDDQPPQRSLTGDALATFNAVIQNVTTEINGYLSTIYPFPLMQIGTVAIFKITGITSDGNGTVTSIEMLDNGNYLTAPASPNSPAYLRHSDPALNAACFGPDWEFCQQGTGLSLTLTFEQASFSDPSGEVIQTNQVDGTPAIAAGGTGYNCGQILVLTGGTSIVPAQIREAALSLICHDLYQRRLAPEEKNMFALQNKKWRGTSGEDGLLTKIGHGDMELDGTFRRFFSPVACWGQRSVLFGANSL